MTSKPHQLFSTCVLIAAVALAGAAGGCKTTRRPEAVPTPNQRAGEAHDLSFRAQAAQRAGKTDQAIDLYRRALLLQPNMPGAWNNLGLLLMEKNQYLDAINALKQEADLVPEDPRPYSNIGVAYARAGFGEDALKAYETALERDPNWPDALRGVAETAQKLNRADEKIAEILRRGLLVETDPAWRSRFEAERLRVEGILKERKDSSRARSGWRGS